MTQNDFTMLVDSIRKIPEPLNEQTAVEDRKTKIEVARTDLEEVLDKAYGKFLHP